MSAELRIKSSFIQLAKLSNEFKANFELMQCELCKPSLQNQFFIFRRRIDMDRILQLKNDQNLKLGYKVDPLNVYKYEKLYNRFLRLEYFAANSALNFWRELLQKAIDSHVLQERGTEISVFYQQIQDIVSKMGLINPNNISFIVGYAIFLKQIVNNEQEAIVQFERAQNIYNLSISHKNVQNRGSVDAYSEQEIFGDNSAAGVVICALEANQVGMIIHTNNEVERVLGHQRKNLIGKKINNIQPLPIGLVHDRILRRFLDTAKRRVLNHTLQLYALTDEGYVRPISIIVKLYPFMSNKITIVGFINSLVKLDGFEKVSQGQQNHSNLDGLQHHYIITDKNGVVSCISKGLANAVGLNASFFKSTDEFTSQIQIQHLINGTDDIFNSPDLMTNVGVDCEITNSRILESINQERIGTDEIHKAKMKTGPHRINVMMKRMIFDADFCILDVFRVIIYPADYNEYLHGMPSIMQDSLKNYEHSNQDHHIKRSHELGHPTDGSGGIEGGSFYQSLSSTTSSVTSQGKKMMYNKLIQDFKNTIGKRETPNSLKKLSRLLILIILITITISIVDYSMQSKYLDEADQLSHQLVQSESRNVILIELLLYIRSFLNVASGIEFGQYHGASLGRIDRFEYLKQIIQQHTYQLQSVQDFLSQQRTDFDSESQTKFEIQPIQLFRISDKCTVDTYDLHYRIAINTFLNNILILNTEDRDSVNVNPLIIKGSPIIDNISNNTTITQTDKDVFYLIVNGMRSLRERTYEAQEFKLQTLIKFSQTHGTINFLSIMLVGMVISCASLGAIVYQIIVNQRNKKQIMTIFALIRVPQIKFVYDICDSYIDRFHSYSYHQIDTENQIESAKAEQNNSSNSNSLRKQIAQQMDKPEKNKSKFSKKHTVIKLEKLESKQSKNIEERKFEDFDDEDDGTTQSGEINFDVPMTRSEKQKLLNSGIIPKEYYQRLINWSITYIYDIGYQNPTQEEQRRIKRSLKNGAAEINEKGVLESKKLTGKKVPKLNDALIDEKPQKQELLDPNSKNKKKKLFKQFQLDPNTTNLSQNNSQMNDETLIEDSKDEMFDSSISEDQVTKTNEKGKKQGNNRRSSIFSKNKKNIEEEFMKSGGQQRIDMSLHEIQVKVEMLKNSPKQKKKCFKLVMINSIVSLIFFAYFIYTYVYHKIQLQILENMIETQPLFFERYEYLIQSFMFLRERVINQNVNLTKIGYKLPKTHQIYDNFNSIDQYFHQNSMRVEREISRLKVNIPIGLETIIKFVNTVDSEAFCPTFFEVYHSQSEEKAVISKNSESKLEFIRREAYQTQLSTVIAACKAASMGNVNQLKSLYYSGVDMNMGDYDQRTPLHLAASIGHIETVLFLVQIGVNVNPIDRWGSTPMNDADNFPQIQQYLKSKGGTLGKKITRLPFNISSEVTDDQFRLFYAAYYGDVSMMNSLRLIGWNVNGQDYDGRTALGIAASEGKLDAVKYLIQKGADLNLRDAIGNDPLDDAKREGHMNVVDFLVNEALVRNFCSHFEDGLLQKGMSQVIGIMHKKFEDLDITIESAKNKTALVELLAADELGNQTTHQTTNMTSTLRIFEIFLSTQELYMYKIIMKLIETLNVTYTEYTQNYYSVAQIAFFLFLTIQILTITVFRGRLIHELHNDIQQSKGILNLVPDQFFHENQQEVEKLIKALQN